METIQDLESKRTDLLRQLQTTKDESIRLVLLERISITQRQIYDIFKN